MQQALFISRTSAHLALIKVCRELGMDDETIAKHGRVHAVYKRGNLEGYEARYPHKSYPSYYFPIMEEQL
jgi:hypothetical protein